MAGVRLRAAALARRGRLPPAAARGVASARSRRGRGSCCSATRTTRPAPSTGATSSRRVAGFCREHGLFLVSDEVYREFVYDGQQATSAARACRLRGERDRRRQPVEALQRLRHPARLSRHAQPRGLRRGAAHGAGAAVAARPRPARGARDARSCRPTTRRASCASTRRAATCSSTASRGCRASSCASPRAPSTSSPGCRSRTARTSPRWLLADFSHEGATVMVAPAPGLLRHARPRPRRGAHRLRALPGRPRGLGARPGSRAAAVRGGPGRAALGRAREGLTSRRAARPRRERRRLERATAVLALTLVALGLAVAQLRLQARADVERARERLLAGDAAAASALCARAERWPGERDRARAGETLAAAASGTPRGGAFAGRARFRSRRASRGVGASRRAPRRRAFARRSSRALGAPARPALLGGARLRGRRRSGGARGGRGEPGSARRPRTRREAGACARGPRLRRPDAAARPQRRAGREQPGVRAVPSGRRRCRAGVGRTRARAGPSFRRAALRLTVDLELSRSALAALGERRGSIVLVDARSGALLAAVSDERTSATEGAAALTQRLEPASIAKLLTAAAAYRNGLDPDAAISRMTCTGVERYGGQQLWCAFPSGPLAGLDDALAKSCNVAFANLGVALGASRMADEYRRWGFDAAPPRCSEARDASTRRRGRRASSPTCRSGSSSSTSRRCTRRCSRRSWPTTGACPSRACSPGRAARWA